MNDVNSLSSHFKMLDTIVVTTNDLVDSLSKADTVDNVIYSTTSEVFKFLSKVLSMVPELLISNYDNSIKKSDLNNSFEDVLHSWSEYIVDKKQFVATWNEFYDLWNRFYQKFKNTNYKENTIFLSLN